MSPYALTDFPLVTNFHILLPLDLDCKSKFQESLYGFYIQRLQE